MISQSPLQMLEEPASPVSFSPLPPRQSTSKPAPSPQAPLPPPQPLDDLQLVPRGSCDSHIHVIDPSRFPLARDAVYRPSLFTTQQALAFESSIRFQKLVLVQPSIYGTDNACLLESLRSLGPARARAVVALDPDSAEHAAPTLLQQWHALGVRGVRLNLQSVGQRLSDTEFAATLRRHADIVRPLGWVLQLYIPMSMLPLLERLTPELDVTLCLDHFAAPDLRSMSPSSTSLPSHFSTERPRSPYDVQGFEALLRLLSSSRNRVYVKISAAYRLATDAQDLALLDRLVAEMLRVAGGRRLVWASDWPHTRFEGHDVVPFLVGCLRRCGDDEGLRRRLFRDNAEELWWGN